MKLLTPTTNAGKVHFPLKISAAILAGAVGSTLLLCTIVLLRGRRRRVLRRENESSIEEDPIGNSTKQISELNSLQFDLRTIEAATNKFSNNYKLGEGGFGPVYKVIKMSNQIIHL